MVLSVGDRLGRFEILGSLGVGGMGEVYRARDPQLRREVAIKVLPAAFSRDPDRQRRFEQEARAAGSLNHPNILAVHDVGVQDGATWIVTELLEGETLRERISARPLAPRTALDYAIQIANGLAAAHERGIVHRDIKPANLFVTRDGRIKILDFGLAKLTGPDAGEATEVIAADGVHPAAVMGTAVYMAPEQVRGRRTDHRSDIFSFGTVFYEMLAGFPPFRRAATAETLNAILNDDPPELSRAAPVDASVERLVLHCLEKEPDARFQNARDLAFHLEMVPHAMATPPIRATRRRSRSTGLVAAGLVAALTVALLVYFVGRRVTTTAGTRADYSARRVTEFAGVEEFPSISPDRRAVAFTANVDGRRQIFVRLLASGAPLQITFDPIDHRNPRWSPDSSSILYYSPATPDESQGTIWSVPALRGPPRRVMAGIGGADVNRSGRVVCFSLVDGHVQLVTAALDGSDVRTVARFDAAYHRYPRWSPDGRWIAFQRGDGVRFDLFVVPAAGGEPRQLTHDRNIMSGLAWLPDSTGLVYGSSRGSTIPYLPPLRLWEAWMDGRPGASRDHIRRSLVRRTGRARKRPGRGVPYAAPIRRVEDPVRACGDGQRSAQCRGDPPDRPGVDADGGSRRRSDCVFVRQRRSQQHMGRLDAERRAPANHLRRRSSGDGRRAGVVAGRRFDCARLVEGADRTRFRRLARQPRWQQSAQHRDAGTRHGVVARRPMALLRRLAGRRAEEGRDRFRCASDRAIGAGAERHRPLRNDALLPHRAPARRRPSGVRNTGRVPRVGAVKAGRAHPCVASGKLANRQSLAVTRRRMARAAAHRRLHDERPTK